MSSPLASIPSNFLDLTDLSIEQIDELLRVTDSLRDEQVSICENKTLALVFEKPSTRTRVSFAAGIRQLGGDNIFLSDHDIQLARGESIPDTARTLSRYVDMIACRTFEHERIELMADYTDIPVINALTDWSHPCQALADIYTMSSKKNTFDFTLSYYGDGNNVCHSLMQGASICGFTMKIAAPDGYQPDSKLLESLQSQGAEIIVTNEPENAVDGADFIYTDVWASMGEEDEAEQRRKIFAPFQVNDELVSRAKPDVKVMHCLPAHRGEEITDSVMEGSHSIVFDQAENRLHAQKALMAVLLTGSEEISGWLK